MLTFLMAAVMGMAVPGLDACDVTWDTPGGDAYNFVPLGNGDIAVSAWVEASGDLCFYIGKTDAWSEEARLLKLGLVRVVLTPALPVAPFRQTLHLADGVLEIAAGTGDAAATVRLWVDALHPAIRVDVQRVVPGMVSVKLEPWRTAERTLSKEEAFSAYGLAEGPNPVVVTADTVVADLSDRVAWYHRNERSIWRETMEFQGMGAWAQSAEDPLLHRTFGGCIRGEGFSPISSTELRSDKPQARSRFAVYCLTRQTHSASSWLSWLAEYTLEADAVAWDDAWAAHRDWWRAFWERSWVDITGGDDAACVSRGYTLQRYMNACGGRGAYPIKFNGSILTVPSREKGRVFDADYRAWGGPYWFQNTRHMYWPMLACGDFDMMQPLFAMYAGALPFLKERTRVYYGHDGAFFPETMHFWGAYATDNYGWNRAGKSAADIENPYIRWYRQAQLELVALGLDYYECTRDEAFLKDTLLPLADAFVTFFDRHYGRRPDGKLLLKPAQALETWQNVVDPLPEIAGLQWVLDRLAALPAGCVTEEQGAFYRGLRGETPALPVRREGRREILAAAREILEKKANSENPELYAVFPYRLFGAGKPDIEKARGAYAARLHKGFDCWRQDDIQAAYLGMRDEARKGVTQRFSNKHPECRFPACWGPNNDWFPDQDHGGAGMMAVQAMLLQADGGKIRLFPAWPKEWDVDFKLHAPGQTVVSGRLRAGKLEAIDVQPPERKADVVVMIE